MATATLEERVAILEAEVGKVKSDKIVSEAGRPGVRGRTNPELIKSMFGQFEGSANFDAVMQSIEAERERERRHAEQEAEADAVPA